MSLDTPLQLPALRTLHLRGFLDDSANFITENGGNCPNLQILILDELSLKCFNINAPQLRVLELSYRGYCIVESYESEIVVSAPRLTSFKFEGNASPVFSPASFPCLDDVYVNLLPSIYFDSTVKDRMPLNVIKCLGSFEKQSRLYYPFQPLRFLQWILILSEAILHHFIS